MTQPGITIPAGELSAVVQKAILDALSAESKEALLAAALAQVMEKPEVQDRYSSTKKYGDSPLERAFKDAMGVVVREVAAEVVAELKPQIAEKLRPMLEAVGATDGYGSEEELHAKLFAQILTWSKEQESKRRRGY